MLFILDCLERELRQYNISFYAALTEAQLFSVLWLQRRCKSFLLLFHLLLDSFHIHITAPIMHILKAQHVPNLLVRQRRFELAHLACDLDVGVIPLQDLTSGFNGGDGGVGGVEDLIAAFISTIGRLEREKRENIPGIPTRSSGSPCQRSARDPSHQCKRTHSASYTTDPSSTLGSSARTRGAR